MRHIPSSELIINDDGSIFHLHLRPEQLADLVILVGDPGRVELVASRFESVEFKVESREFRSVTGSYKGRRMTVLSTGIGIGNIDICMTELDALANIDFESRTVKKELRQLTIVRLGTSGALQEDIKVGEFIFAKTSLGFDSLLNYYEGCNEVCDMELKKAFVEQVKWNKEFPNIYAADADAELTELFKDSTREGITIASPGFYAPQGRFVRIKPAEMDLNQRIEKFEYNGRKVTNYEMESSVMAGLGKMMGHRVATICTIIAQRVKEDACTDYKPFVEKMIDMAIDKLASEKR
ncbi:MAG: nucleoside phosphorylase [Rikenellaceae bacterium]